MPGILETISLENVMYLIPYEEGALPMCDVCAERLVGRSCYNFFRGKIETRLIPFAKNEAMELGLKLK